MQIIAVFESWLIGDGNYPAFAVGMEVNLSFEMMMDDVRLEEGQRGAFATPSEDATYQFGGCVIARYEEPEPVVVVNCGALQFYAEGLKAAQFQVGNHLSGAGVLAVDYYSWVENIESRPTAPDLFYNCRVERIRRACLPEESITRTIDGKSYPTRVPIALVHDIRDVLSMREADEVFYILNLETVGAAVPRTFIGG